MYSQHIFPGFRCYLTFNIFVRLVCLGCHAFIYTFVTISHLVCIIATCIW